jgi:diketogulonate reductase-like aldo/keto reductase
MDGFESQLGRSGSRYTSDHRYASSAFVYLALQGVETLGLSIDILLLKESLSLTLQSRRKLNDGVEIPILGLGVYQAAPGRATQQAVGFALEVGYRLIDTASLYGNERDVGKSVRESDVPRGDVFVTTKLWNSDHGYDSTLRAFEKSLALLGLEYIDLYLIHWPVFNLRRESWKAMEKLRKEGKCRSIGVSNYTIRHLKELLEESDVVPSVNQVEFNPFLYQKELVDFCNKNGIQIEAYSPLTKGHRLREPTIVEIAQKYSRTPAQVMIRWSIQHGFVVIPKSVRRERIIENSQVFDFEISREDMAKLDSLDESFRMDWDPTTQP